jgi:hypothetical protein
MRCAGSELASGSRVVKDVCGNLNLGSESEEGGGPARGAHDDFAPIFNFIVRVNRRAVGNAGLTLWNVGNAKSWEVCNCGEGAGCWTSQLLKTPILEHYATLGALRLTHRQIASSERSSRHADQLPRVVLIPLWIP